MEKITGIFTHFKERFANPLIFSFFCSWLIINWEIVIAVMWHDARQLEIEKYYSIFEFLKVKINKWDSLIYPFFSAVIYTVAIPFVRVGVTVLQAVASKLSEKWEIGILGGSKISMDKYLSIREDYIKRTKLLEEEIEKENEYKNNFENIKTKNLQLETDLTSSKLLENENQKEIEDLEKNISDLKPTILKNITSAFDKEVIWQNDFILPDGREGSEIFSSVNDGFTLKDGRKYKIQNIKLSADKKILIFDKIINNKAHHNILILNGELNYYGIEDEKTIVSYKRRAKSYIEIISAKYFYEKNYIDVKSKLQKYVDSNITKITPTNSEMGGDPFWGKPKMLEIIYKIDGKEKIVRGLEKAEITID
ncbi:MAG: hypothetical protein A3F72_14095 [Bacteroidetes bacterium RIFCSPLOWO2_12_FULL_35_15]|nr:MAG: hypothetical protein A3F72_14095 [Bacteroidetes bacterium RIFCSPLOWO2_12_FULL_35_15]